MADSVAEWGQIPNLANAICEPPLMDFAAVIRSELQLDQTQWPERVTADRYPPSDIAALICTVF